jgi:DNA (cytosine-5)-methyltransferase 1
VSGLILSLFPGIGLLDMAFEAEGFCVVRGPDLLWGGDVRNFHPPAGRFEGVIGGPPCQLYGGLANFAHRWKHAPEHLIPEYERVVSEAGPGWWVMENVQNAPLPEVAGWRAHDVLLNNRWFGEEQSRIRRFTFGTVDGRRLVVEGFEALENMTFRQAVTSANAGHRKTHAKGTGGTIAHYTLAEALRLQGLPADFLDHAPFTDRGARKVIAQGVPLPMGRAIARAVKAALAAQERTA